MGRLTLHERVLGSLIGGAVGDALGSPMECLHYKDIRRIFGNIRYFEDFTPEMIAQATGIRGYGCSVGSVTDDTVLSDVLLDCIIKNEGAITAYSFAKEWEIMEEPVHDNSGKSIVRLNKLHWIERIPFYRNRLREVNKRELGQGEANATNAIMYISPVGLLCAGDPLTSELMAIDITSVNQHGGSRDVAAGYCAALAACFIPGLSVEDIVKTGIEHTRDYRHSKEIKAIIELAGKCGSCEELIERYYTEIIGPFIPLRDLQSEDQINLSVSWNSSEILGPVLGTFLITKGKNPEEMILACAKIGRDADTIARCAGGLMGAYAGFNAIPKAWKDFVLPRNSWLRLEEKGARLTEIILGKLRHGCALRQSILDTN